MKVIDYFGPRVAKDKLTVQETAMLFDICNQAKEPFNHELVGYIKEEVGITERLRNSSLYPTILNKMKQYLTEIDNGMWKKVVESKPDFNLLDLKAAWYNKQIALEFNPLHDHRHPADLVCVMFPKIHLDESVSEYFDNYQKEKQTGQLNFVFGENVKNDFGIVQITVQPEEGDVFIFPSTLKHYTAPVLGNSFRYSVSCNFSFSSLSTRLLQKLNSNED
jgi:hypothetical protein